MSDRIEKVEGRGCAEYQETHAALMNFRQILEGRRRGRTSAEAEVRLGLKGSSDVLKLVLNTISLATAGTAEIQG